MENSKNLYQRRQGEVSRGSIPLLHELGGYPPDKDGGRYEPGKFVGKPSRIS